MNTNSKDDFLRHLEKELIEMPLEQPSSDAKARFMDFVAHEEQTTPETKVFKLKQWIPQISIAAMFLLVFGTILYTQSRQNNQLHDSLIAMNTKMEKLLQNESPTERIKAITVGYELGADVNDQMIQTLVDVLHNDESSNVRQTAVETLGYYIDNEDVRSALIKALAKEKDTIVKLSIIQAITMKKDDTSKDLLEAIVKGENQDPFVINEANMQLGRFKEY